MDVDEAHAAVKQVGDLFAKVGDGTLPSSGEINEAAEVLAALTKSNAGVLRHDRKGVLVIDKQLADDLLSLSSKATQQATITGSGKDLSELINGDYMPHGRIRL